MAAPWFFVEAIPPVGAHWPLPRDEAKHATGAKRLAAGDAIVLFDGRGAIAEATLGAERLRDGSVPVLVHAIRAAARSGPIVHLATALPKGDRLGTLIDMVTQLGVASVTPLRCERSVVGDSEARGERMRRIMIESCKQARVAWLPTLHGERTPADLLAAPGAARVVALHPDGEPLARAVEGDGETLLLVGPEGGFSERELEAFDRARARRARLGASILRVETAAVTAVAVVKMVGDASSGA